MSDPLGRLNDSGIEAFRRFLQALREGLSLAPPFNLLTDPSYSCEVSSSVQLQRQEFPDSYAFGEHLRTALASLNRREIVNDNKLWSWLALYFFDQICPVEDGKRNVLEDAVYILADIFNHQRYYRHIVRTPWLAVVNNGEFAKVLLQTKAGGKRSDIFEQLASRQTIFGNPTIIAGAFNLYYDVEASSPKRGASGKGPGSSRRLVAFVRQIDLTYDLRDCTPEQFIALLPREFDRYKGVSSTPPIRKTNLPRIISRI